MSGFPAAKACDGDEIGPKMLARIAKRTGLSQRDLWNRECLDRQFDLAGPFPYDPARLKDA